MENFDKPVPNKRIRCINIDWLEVYAEESFNKWPMNAEYFRSHNYVVSERDYGTRVWQEMFVIEDEEGHPWIEVRRNPKSGTSEFTGLNPQSCHLRLTNRACYVVDCVDRLRQFMLKHSYIFKRISRIDICLDFIKFDSGDDPEKFARRYIQERYRKINQAHISPHGVDNWNSFEWESLSWGSPSSMVSTKMYDKTKELAVGGHDKPYIRYAWFMAGLISNPIDGAVVDRKGNKSYPHVWRVEFSLKSSARDWIVIENQHGKRPKKQAIPHRLSTYDAPDKLWARFQDLAYHYFRFKYKEYKSTSASLVQTAMNDVMINPVGSEIAVQLTASRELQRKDRCRDKVLFYWDSKHEFLQLKSVPPASKPDRDDTILLRRLRQYRLIHSDQQIRQACDAIIDAIKRTEVRRLTPHNINVETEALQRAIAIRMGGTTESILETIERVKALILNKEIF